MEKIAVALLSFGICANLAVASTMHDAPASVGPAAPAACDGISRTLTKAEKKKWAAPIASQLLKKNQLKAHDLQIQQVLRLGDWRIILVATNVSDDPYLFYSGDPAKTAYLTLWAGGASQDEGDEIFKDVSEKAPGLPQKLARCFSWQVTHQ